MQWGQIKSLFIVCFLILDIFLLQQFLKTMDSRSPSGDISEPKQEEVLQENIKGLDMLPEEQVKDSFITVKARSFTADDVEKVKAMNDQEVFLLSGGNLLYSELKEPVAIDSDSTNAEKELTLSEIVLSGSEYTYWGQDEVSGALIFFQTNNSKPIYYSQSSFVVAFTNSENEITSYLQAALDEVDRQDPKTMISAYQAVSNLYKAGELIDSEITETPAVGYYSFVDLDEGQQVFAPSWHIPINDNQHYVVMGYEGQFSKHENPMFVRNTIRKAQDGIRESQLEEEEIEQLRKVYQGLLESTRVSDEE
ncbi:two-component system regulatory protein YycI [Virgibacillus senegalensis]|uniref:two-component system regulatory protein YycI n=1 Tax=Virgibacillus senegalensis TaxID=1499679 RepID=UPI00069F1A1F|nr:two-component system regulatory protein YycI [Virgibacillus senegalensis]